MLVLLDEHLIYSLFFISDDDAALKQKAAMLKKEAEEETKRLKRKKQPGISPAGSTDSPIPPGSKRKVTPTTFYGQEQQPGGSKLVKKTGPAAPKITEVSISQCS